MAKVKKEGAAAAGKKKDSAGFPYQFKPVQEEPVRRSPKDRPRLQVRYEESVRPALIKQFGYRTPLMVPNLDKIVCNIGLGDALKTPKLLEQAFASLGLITGQRPVVTRARKSISNFKLRQGNRIGCMVTLRGPRMWEFLDRFLSVALPRTRDFRGLSRKALDGHGNYSVGVKELLIFPEVDYEALDKVTGMNVCIHTTAKTDEEGGALLDELGMPFRKA